MSHGIYRELRDDERDNYQTLLQYIEECEESDRLSEWESEFIKSIKEYLERKKTLTPKQFEVLQRISKKIL